MPAVALSLVLKPGVLGVGAVRLVVVDSLLTVVFPSGRGSVVEG